MLAHPDLFLWSHAHSACPPALLHQAESPHMGQCPMPRQWVCGCPAPCMEHALMRVCRGCLVRASWCIYLCARRCALAWVDECTRCISISSAVFGCIRGCPSMWPVLDMLPSKPVHLWLHPCCIPSCVPAPACAAVALHRWLRAMAPAGCKYWQRGGEVERFMAQGQARES